MPTTQLERGWVNTSAVTIMDTARMVAVNTVLLDDVDLGAANPWGITCTADGTWLCVAISGTHELSVMDRARLHEKLAAAEAAGEKDGVPNDLSFTVGLRRRVKLPGKGPRGLAALDSRVFAAEYFTGTLAAVDLASERPLRGESFALGAEPALTPARAGELFFHDATVCFQQWQSCASCHPGDARVDGLNWDLLNDGMGNPNAELSANVTQGHVQIGLKVVPGPTAPLPRTANQGARTQERDRLNNGKQHIDDAQLFVNLQRLMELVPAQNAKAASAAEQAGQLDDRFVVERVSAPIHHMHGIVATKELLRRRRHAAPLRKLRVRAVVLSHTFGQCLQRVLLFKGVHVHRCI
ncbi:MAG: hypothetical protein Q8L40_02640, partial [Burkholderiales bacterium]|nr:hypothetical protein [Burkholderiales bacterium]